MHELNESEQETLRILWKIGEAKPGQVQEEFGWEIDNGTLRSVLVNLVEKGVLTRRKAGKAFLYRAKSRRGSQFSQAIKRLAEIFTGGSTSDLILELMRRENLSPKDIEKLREVANRKEPDKDTK